MRIFNRIGFVLGGLAIMLAAQNAFSQSVNRQPIIDAAQYARSQGVDWTKPFSVNISAVIGRDGRLDDSRTKYLKTGGDAKTVAAFKRYISALSESGMLGFFSGQGVESVQVRITSAASGFSLTGSSPQSSAQRAQTMAAGLNNLASMVRGMRDDQVGADVKTIFNNLKATASGKNVNIVVALPAATFRNLTGR